MMKVGDIAFLHGGTPVQVKEILKLRNEVHYQIELLQHIVGQNELEIPTKETSIPITTANNQMVHKISTAVEATDNPPKKRARFANDEIYLPSIPSPTHPRQTKTSMKAADAPRRNVIHKGRRSWEKNTTAHTINNSTSNDNGSSNSAVASDHDNGKPPHVGDQGTGTQCSTDDYFATEDSVSCPNHTIVKLKELPFYTTGRGTNTGYPYSFCRICKNKKTSWGCLECSTEDWSFCIHHPQDSPSCWETHMKSVTAMDKQVEKSTPPEAIKVSG